MATLTWWLFAALFENTAADLASHVFWMNLTYIGIATLPVMWLIFTLRYSERGKWWRRNRLPLLFILPAVTIIMVWTNGLHHLMFKDIQLLSVYPPAEVVTFSTWFWIHSAYSYLLILAGTVNLLNLFFRTSGIYRKQLGIMLAAAFIPWVANFAYIAHIGLDFSIDPTPVAFVIMGIAFFWGLSRVKLLNIMPVAYEAIFNSISDGVIVLDGQNRIREINPVAAPPATPAGSPA